MQIKLSQKIFNFLFLFFLFSSTLQAKSENLISLDKVIENVLIHHPELKEKMAMIDVSKAEKKQLSHFLPAAPTLSLEYQTDQFFQNEGEGVFSLKLAQEFEIFGQAHLRKKLGEIKLKQASSDFNFSKHNIIAQTKKLFFEIFYLNQKLNTLKTHRALINTFSKNAKKLVQENSITDYEANSWQTQFAMTDLEFKNIENQIEEYSTQLSYLSALTIKASLLKEPSKIDKESIPTENELTQFAKNHRQDLQKLILNYEEKEKLVQLNKRKLLPNPEISIGYSIEKSSLSGNDFNGSPAFLSNLGEAKKKDQFLSVGLQFKLPFPHTYSNEIQKSKSELKLAQIQKQNLEEQLTLDIKNLRRKLLSLQEWLKEFDGPFKKIPKQLKELTLAYQNNNIDYNDYLAHQEKLSKLRLDYIDTRLFFIQTQIDLELALGKSLSDKERKDLHEKIMD